jgi:hypothetical protein
VLSENLTTYIKAEVPEDINVGLLWSSNHLLCFIEECFFGLFIVDWLDEDDVGCIQFCPSQKLMDFTNVKITKKPNSQANREA